MRQRCYGDRGTFNRGKGVSACAYSEGLALERIVLAAVPAQNEYAPLVYLVRLGAFGLIIAGIVDKNRKR